MGGWRTEALVRTELSRLHPTSRRNGRTPSVALVAGLEAAADVVTPSNIVADTDPNDLITGPMHFAVDRRRATPREPYTGL